MDKDLFIPKSKKRKIDDINNNNEEHILKKKKIEITKDIDLLISNSKVVKFAENGRFSMRNKNDYSINNNKSTIIENLPESMKYDLNKIIPERENHNSLLLDNTNSKWGPLKHNLAFSENNNPHIVKIIPQGFQDILPTKEILEIAIPQCKNEYNIMTEKNKDNIDEKIIKEEEKNEIIIKKETTPIINIKDSESLTINKITILNVEGINFTYTFSNRLSQSKIKSTIKAYTEFTLQLKEEFFKDNELFNKDLNTNINKTELFKKLTDQYEEQYKEKNKINSKKASKDIKYSLPELTRSYIKQFRFPPRIDKGERLCIRNNSCLFNTFESFQSTKDNNYIGREFLLPRENDIFKSTKKLPEIIGPCIDCLLYEWSNKYNIDVLQKNQTPKRSINTFRVKVEPGEYNSKTCHPKKLLNGQLTGFYGWVPAYGSHLRAFITEKKYEELSDGSLKYDEIPISYLAEVNTDFRKSLVK